MKIVKLRNKLDIQVRVKEGNANVLTVWTALNPNDTFDLKLDPNVTYREYILIMPPHNTKLESPFSSDDVNDISEIIIEKNEEDKIVWKGVLLTEKPGKTKFLKCLFKRHWQSGLIIDRHWILLYCINVL